uniref:stAR-related lipid transfer protein 3 isoform X1 n=1 Tax=Ciona intestinalis TaxID=7719 RepID=UPI0002B8EFD0|nr:stAR-related lipid transfer protein 3 isoform X1 [Ciona intestinalis]XP_018667135.1 stAR-related lipid transfer protein 3 isoform X1 [Ciona intestinalis]|eukprot:XP_002130557.2 stAR-related lipid transfer protein 3 isoform X1 [Ciona intestinalis]
MSYADLNDDDTTRPLLPQVKVIQDHRNHNNCNDAHSAENHAITFYATPAAPTPGVEVTSPSQHWHNQSHRSEETSSLLTLASDRRISDPRRTFCLFVTFDFLITVLLWLTECGISSTNGKDPFFTILNFQMSHFYKPSESLFDVTMLAAVRFLFLVLSYAILRIKHYWPVAVSTAVSDVLLILKIFGIFAMSKQTSSLNLPMTIVVVLADFVLTWIEVWFVDFKVLPAEMKLAQKTVRDFLQQSYQSTPPQDDGRRFVPRPSYGATSERASFYSPAATPPGSECGHAESMYYSMHGYHRNNSNWSEADVAIVNEGKNGLDQLWELYQNNTIWKTEKVLSNGDTVFSYDNKEFGKTFKIVANIPAVTPSVLFNEIIRKPEEMPQWNKTVSDVKVLGKVGEQTFITLEVSAPAAMGLISSREFVTVRRVDKFGDDYVSAGISTNACEHMVPKSNFVRGVNGPTGFVVGPGADGPYSTKFIWILNTNLMGNLSRSLVNRNLTSTMINFVSAMKERLKVL